MLTSENHNTVATFIEKKRIKDRSKKLNKKHFSGRKFELGTSLGVCEV